MFASKTLQVVVVLRQLCQALLFQGEVTLPKFDNIDDTIRYLADEITKVNLRASKLEGKLMALGNSFTVAANTSGDMATVRKVAKSNLDSVSSYLEKTDDPGTKALIAGFIEQMEEILNFGSGPDGPIAFKIIQGGKTKD